MVQTLEQPRPKTDLKQVDLRLALTDDVVGDLPLRIKCPNHSDSDPSLCIYPDHLWCYSVGCSFHIPRRMEALAWLLDIPLREAFKVAYKYTNQGLEAYRQRVEMEARTKPLPVAQAKLYHTLAYKERRNGYRPVQWYYGRGLTDDTIERFCLGHDGTRYTIPIYAGSGKLLNIRFRLDEHYTDETDYAEGKLQKKYSGLSGRNGAYTYPEWLVDPDCEEIVICEGELDAVRLHQEGYNAITSTNGAGNLIKCLESLTKTRKYGRLCSVSICTDQDEAGDYVAEQLFTSATGTYHMQRLTWPREWGKDVTELYQSGHSLRDAQIVLRPGVSVMQ